MSQKAATKTDLIEVRYTDIGQSRPSLCSSGIVHIHRVVTNIQTIESQRGQAETGEIRFGGKQVKVYRLCGSGSGSWWGTNRVAFLEPIRAAYSLVKSPVPEGASDSSCEIRNA